MKRNSMSKFPYALLLGIVVGLLVSAYAYKSRGQHDDLMAFRIMFLPMLVTLGLAALMQGLLWYCIGRKFPNGDGGGRNFRERAKIFQAKYQGSWLGALYGYLAGALSFGSGYISITPLIALFLL